MPCSSTHDSTKLLLSLDNHQSGMRRRNDDQVAQNMSSSLTKYDWDIIQSIDNNEMLSFTQKVMWKNWLIDLKTRWSDTVHHYMSLMLEELKQQRRFRTITEEEVQSWIHPMMQTFENIWNIIRQMMNDWNRMKPLTAMVRQSDVKTILFDWFLQHAFEPYPSEEEKEWLAIQTGWTAQQVNHW
ncbi:uncharacterized protein Gasu_00230 [Galdieria sulphuraria]|uniref:KN homeodomain domain-containing protein n=1 Tax=Galdieria sulphuraria TaxID=130081 RepID=M2W9R5_GALSU|nr:uncharacterized protein Gasu_00230 [Galdieria sulphuraria]EME32651.1 hypothetical protein Gasu_00230 [Galdieria sulphuraria]|eukprot:XP_005709171.1 hypothetical protein Gasu_00230 [Galdieria sulphuraria]